MLRVVHMEGKTSAIFLYIELWKTTCATYLEEEQPKFSINDKHGKHKQSQMITAYKYIYMKILCNNLLLKLDGSCI